MSEITLFRNGRILTSQGWIRNGSLLVKGDRILDVSRTDESLDGDVEIIDARGGEIVPGAIELHAHGGNGHNFKEASETAFQEAVNAHLFHGSTSIYPTLSSVNLETAERVIELTTEMMSRPDSPILGLHLEGPYFNENMVGEQSAEHIIPFHPDIYQHIIRSAKCLKRWDAAPELEGAEEFGSYCMRHRVLPSIAHTQATFKDVFNAYEAGFTHVTHFYNGMTYFHKTETSKQEGTVESVLSIPEFTVELIFDGIHLPPAILRMIYVLKGLEKIAIVTNAHTSMGLPESRGRVATMDHMIQVAVKKAGIQFEDAIRMTSETPAKIMGEHHHVGILRKGYDANICIYDNEANLQFVMQKGKVIRNELSSFVNLR